MKLRELIYTLEHRDLKSLSPRHIEETNIVLKMLYNCPLPDVTIIHRTDTNEVFATNLNLVNFYTSLITYNNAYCIDINDSKWYINTEKGFYDLSTHKLVEEFDKKDVVFNFSSFFDYDFHIYEYLREIYNYTKTHSELKLLVDSFHDIGRKLNTLDIPYNYHYIDNEEELNSLLKVYYSNSYSNI